MVGAPSVFWINAEGVQESITLNCVCFLNRTILPDFFKKQAPWEPSNDWSSFDDWLKSRDPKNINKWEFKANGVYYSLLLIFQVGGRIGLFKLYTWSKGEVQV